jgi:PAS domain S-box-containing protein
MNSADPSGAGGPTGGVERDRPLAHLAYFPNPIWRADASGMCDWFNPSWLEFTGRRMEEEVGNGWAEGVHPDDFERCLKIYLDNFAQRSAFQMEYRLRYRDGSYRTILDCGAPFFGENGEFFGYIGSCYDIETIKTLENERSAVMARAHQRQKMEALGELTGGIAHSFNNQLAAMMGYIDLALMRFAHADPTLAKYLEQSQAAGQRARDLVARLLAFGRPGTSTDLGPFAEGGIRDSLEILRHVLPASIDFTIHIDESAPAPSIAAGEMNEILMNLVINARDAVGEHGRLAIDVRRQRFAAAAHCASCRQEFDGEFFAVSVSDNGPGIADAVLPRLFDPFFTTHGLARSTGLGLSVVHGIVHAHRGHLLVTTPAGGGACLTVLLPVRSGASRHLQTPASASVPPRGAGKRVLLAEDDDLVRAYLLDVLENDGFDVVSTIDGMAALQALRNATQPFDLLLTDQVMPGMSGIELIREVAMLQPDLPTIICSGYSHEDIRPQSRELGVTSILRKPVQVSELRGAMQQAFRGH